ncbi:hypothetical protein VTI28DRAFT_2628 [Corynascus sepedonium]
MRKTLDTCRNPQSRTPSIGPRPNSVTPLIRPSAEASRAECQDDLHEPAMTTNFPGPSDNGPGSQDTTARLGFLGTVQIDRPWSAAQSPDPPGPGNSSRATLTAICVRELCTLHYSGHSWDHASASRRPWLTATNDDLPAVAGSCRYGSGPDRIFVINTILALRSDPERNTRSTHSSSLKTRQDTPVLLSRGCTADGGICEGLAQEGWLCQTEEEAAQALDDDCDGFLTTAVRSPLPPAFISSAKAHQQSAP